MSNGEASSKQIAPRIEATFFLQPLDLGIHIQIHLGEGLNLVPWHPKRDSKTSDYCLEGGQDP